MESEVLLMQLAPGVTIAQRSVDCVQIGFDELRRVVARGLTPRAIALLLEAQTTRLWPGGEAVIPASLTREVQMYDLVLAADLPAPQPVIDFHGVNGLMLQVARDLLASGLAQVRLRDTNVVAAQDVGPGGFDTCHVGRSRQGAGSEILGLLEPMPQDEPDFVVSLAPRVVDPVSARAYMSNLVPHLYVVYRDASVEIGPFIYPGSNACINCMHLEQAGVDEEWLTLMANVLNEPAPGRGHLPLYVERTASGLVLAQLAAAVAGRRPYTAWAPQDRFGSSVVSVAVPSGLPRVRAVTAHPECGCITIPA